MKRKQKVTVGGNLNSLALIPDLFGSHEEMLLPTL